MILITLIDAETRNFPSILGIKYAGSFQLSSRLVLSKFSANVRVASSTDIFLSAGYK
ncbi:MAG: hypothetical protein JNN15_00825 [Blastocatellia bacterium]|nr:hypothetical protein [Blastocatellia bacterium]